MSADTNTEFEKLGIIPGEELSGKSNTELLDEINAILTATEITDETVAADEVERRLNLLQERAPVAEEFDANADWEDLQRKHLYIVQADGQSEKNTGPGRTPHPKRTIWRIVEIAAAIAVLFTIVASAANEDPTEAIIHWVGDIVQVYTNPSGNMDLPEGSDTEYHSLREALDKNGASDAQCPTWIPEDYAINEISFRRAENIDEISAYYFSNRGDLWVRILTTNNDEVNNIEVDPMGTETVIVDGKSFNIFTNAGYIKTMWTDNTYSYSLSGQISKDELVEIIKSIKSR